MKKKDKASLHSAKPAELTKIVREAKAKLAQIAVNRYSKQSKNVRETKSLRQKIAVSQTILRLKELHEKS